MIYIGIIVWALLIIVIAELTTPGFILLTMSLIIGYALLWILAQYIINRIKDKKK